MGACLGSAAAVGLVTERMANATAHAAKSFRMEYLISVRKGLPSPCTRIRRLLAEFPQQNCHEAGSAGLGLFDAAYHVIAKGELLGRHQGYAHLADSGFKRCVFELLH